MSLRDYNGQVYTQVRQVELESLDQLATVLLLPALLATGLFAVFTFQAGGHTRWLTLTALALLVAIIVLTFVIHIPINADQPDWNVTAPPSDWASVRDRW